MTDNHDRPGRPAGVLTVQGRELPEDLPFVAHPTYAGVRLGRRPALLLAPRFTAFTDEEDSYNPIPYMLSAEGFDYLDLGGITPVKGISPKPARELGWTVRFDGDQVEIGRPGKRMCRTIVDPEPSAPWRQATGRSGDVLVMVLEVQRTFTTTTAVARAATAASGAVTLLPIV